MKIDLGLRPFIITVWGATLGLVAASAAAGLILTVAFAYAPETVWRRVEPVRDVFMRVFEKSAVSIATPLLRPSARMEELRESTREKEPHD